MNRSDQLTFVLKDEGLANPGYTNKWVRSGDSYEAYGFMAVKDIQFSGGKVDIDKVH